MVFFLVLILFQNNQVSVTQVAAFTDQQTCAMWAAKTMGAIQELTKKDQEGLNAIGRVACVPSSQLPPAGSSPDSV